MKTNTTPDFKVVIPARYASTRLPCKALLPIGGKPMIAHVCERALAAHAAEVVVATDDERIQRAVSAWDVRAIMTRADHNNGTERIAEVADICGWDQSELIVNVQGDEPLIPASMIQGVATALADQTRADVATLATPISDPEEVSNPHAVKVVLDGFGYALYFSRAPIPWDRARFGQSKFEMADDVTYLRHIGLYAYTVGFLQRYVNWPASALESVESLEQLRILWNAAPIYVACVTDAPPAGIDTEEDLQRVRRVLNGGPKNK